MTQFVELVGTPNANDLVVPFVPLCQLTCCCGATVNTDVPNVAVRLENVWS